MSHSFHWAQTIIDTLCEQGATQFFLAPGTRSAPLALTLASHLLAKTTVHFDERGLAFHALGYAKASGKTAVIVVTSGTAVGNLLPALMEADQSQIPLLILTADRCPEELDVGANQTSDQNKLFTNVVRWQTSLPSPDPTLSPAYLASIIQQAVAISQGELKGPVHINCAFKDPREEKRPTNLSKTKSPRFIRGELVLPEKVIDRWRETLSHQSRGVILVGDGSEQIEPYASLLAETLQWPLIADILAPTRFSSSPCLISHYDLILQAKPEIQVDQVIQFGNRFVSRTLSQWLKKQTLSYYLSVNNHNRRQDPHHLISDRLQGDPSLFVRDLLSKLQPSTSSHLLEWQRLESQCKETLSSFFSSNPALSESSLTSELSHLHAQGWALFIANSLPIRDCNALFGPHGKAPLFANRGVSGIDGNIATALGIAKAISMPMVAFLGDMASLHDLNSLALLHKSTTPFIALVSNNQGGGIFSSLPFAKHTEHLDPFFTHSHNWDFSHAAALFNIPYLSIRDLSTFHEFCKKQIRDPHSCLVEVHTEIQNNLSIREQLFKNICQTLSEEPLLHL